MEIQQFARMISEEALGTKAKNLKLLDLEGLVSYTDYVVLMTATSTRHAQAIADKIYLKIKKDLGKFPISMEGHASGQWVLIDYGDVVVHIFLEDQRDFYGLDELWTKAPQILLPGQKKPKARPKKPATKQAAAKKVRGKKPVKRKPRSKPKRRK